MSALLDVGVSGIGRYLPERVVTNKELVAMGMAPDAEWIRRRTGIDERHYSARDEGVPEMAVKASRAALEDAKLPPSEIGAIILATSSGNRMTDAPELQHGLGAVSARCLDINAACAGLYPALHLAELEVRSGVNHVLIAASDALSKHLRFDKDGVKTGILFGDGAGALVVSRGGRHRLLGVVHHTDGSQSRLIRTRMQDKVPHQWGGCEPRDVIEMPEGGTVMKAAIAGMVQCTREVVELVSRRAAAELEGLSTSRVNRDYPIGELLQDLRELTIGKIALLILHQANMRIIDAVEGELLEEGLQARVVKNIDKYGNTSAASQIIALSEGLSNKEDDYYGKVAVLTGVGAGLQMGAAALLLNTDPQFTPEYSPAPAPSRLATPAWTLPKALRNFWASSRGLVPPGLRFWDRGG